MYWGSSYSCMRKLAISQMFGQAPSVPVKILALIKQPITFSMRLVEAIGF